MAHALRAHAPNTIERPGTMSKTMKAASHPSITNGKAAQVEQEARTAMEPAGSAQSWARHIIDFDAAVPATYSPHTLPAAEVMARSGPLADLLAQGQGTDADADPPRSITRRAPAEIRLPGRHLDGRGGQVPGRHADAWLSQQNSLVQLHAQLSNRNLCRSSAGVAFFGTRQPSARQPALPTVIAGKRVLCFKS